MNAREDQKRQVQQATDLIRLVGEHVALKPRGREFIGLCPFHDDKNPSMYVSPIKQIYKCFSCGAGGDVFSFVMQYHKMTFPEAIKLLAERAGIKLETFHSHDSKHDDGQPTDRQRIAAANVLAVEFFRTILRHAEHGPVAREYITRRRISEQMVEEFQLGYAPDRWDGLALTIAQKKWDLRGFELAGLVNPRQNTPGHIDRLRHRIIFPICDALGRPIAFGGRRIRDEDEPKYLNSPETALFNKSSTLYGLHLAKKAIIDSRTAVIVEGYTDVIACHQAGVRNVVATLGTALTNQHVTELRRYCEKVVLIYDADEAGIKAADRAVEVFMTGNLDVAIATLPDGLDPAELFETPDGLARWHASVTSATDALAFAFDRMAGRLEGQQTITGRQRLAEEYLQRLAALDLENSGPIRKAMIVQRLATLLHMDEATVGSMLREMTRKQGPRRAPVSPTPAAPASPDDTAPPEDALSSGEREDEVDLQLNSSRMRALRLAARQVIGCLLQQPALFELTLSNGRSMDEGLTPTEFVTEPERTLYQRLYDRLCQGQRLTLAQWLADLADEGQPELASLSTEADAEADRCAEGEAERRAQTLLLAAEALLKHEQNRQYRRLRDASSQAPSTLPADEANMLRRLSEHQRNPSVLRIRRNPTV
jgi:DNA primase